MDINALRVFREVCAQGSYTQAGRKLGLSQSAVSQRIKSLENELGVELFDKLDRTLPTAAGDYLYQAAGKLIVEIEDIANELRAVEGVGAGTVHYGMIDVVAIQLLPNMLSKFREQFPQVKIEAVVKTSQELIEMVEDYRLDFGVVVTFNLPESLESAALFDDSIVAVVQKNSIFSRVKEVSLKELRKAQLILYPASSQTRQLIEAGFTRKGIVPNIAMEMHYPAAMASLVEQGMGIALMSELSARRDKLSAQVAVPIKEFAGIRPLGVVWHKGRKLSPQSRAFIQAMQTSLK